MESDDDFELFPPAEAEPSSPQSHGRRLKRLKRVAEVVTALPVTKPLEDDFPSVDALESADSEPAQSMEFSGEEVREPSDLLRQLGAEDGTAGFDSAAAEPDKEDQFQPVLEFDSVDEEMNVGDEGRETSEEVITRDAEEMLHDLEGDGLSNSKRSKMKKKQRDNGTVDGSEHLAAPPVASKRREEKERRSRMQQLRADSQRVLRESRDASFQPIPMVPKPISSVLEKIRHRKLEISKKFVSVKSNNSATRYLDFSDEEGVDFDLEDPVLKRGDENVPGSVTKEVATEPTERTIPHAGITGEPSDTTDGLSPESVPRQKTLEEEFNPAFQAPTDDTQELFPDHKNDEAKKDPLTDSPRSPMEEVFAPSVLAMKLKFDADPQTSDDEMDNNKENIDPRLDQHIDLSPPIKDPVKDFLDEEAEEEDDSDGDPFNGQDDEDEDIEDAEELNDMIATNYVEKPVDDELRNELHQKWLEQEDARGMKNLLQRIEGAPNQREASLLEDEDQEEEDDEDSDEEFGEDNGEGLAVKALAQMNLKKAKLMISEMYTEKDDPYVSSDDEESERILTKQSLSEKIDGQAKLLSPEEDESSREVFSRIKKLNIMPENKRRTKPSALHDLSLASGRENNFLKPSFLGRGSNSSLLSKNQKTSAFRAFIFGYDDSNSRSAESVSEELSEPVHRESRPTRTPSAKFTSSLAKSSSSQSTKVSTETDSTTSLLDILRRPSIKSDSCVQEIRTQSIFAAFRIGKRSREGRVVT